MNSRYLTWLNQEDLDLNIKQELEAMTDSQIEESFSMELKFGTGGIRGVLGAGDSKLNRYTVSKAVEGFSRYLKENTLENGVVIAYDNRHQSEYFAKLSAGILASHNIKSFVFKKLRPTPVLSYAVRALNASAGIMITASHNPKEYNGLKMYDDKGCQLVPRYANKVIDHIQTVEDIFSIKPMDFQEALENKLTTWIDESLEKAYLQSVLAMDEEKTEKSIKIGFSPQHGTAADLGPRLLKEAGFKIFEEASQMDPDPDFKGTKSANPEDKRAFEKLEILGKKENCELLIATDPDADRLGVAVYHQGTYHYLNGNQTGALLLDYLINKRKKAGSMPKKGIVFSTIVSSDLGEKMAKKNGLSSLKTLTGFKYIGEQMALIEDTPFSFFMGYEESYGYVLKDITRDKDALQALMMVSLMADEYLKENKTLIDQLETIYQTYGYYLETLENIALKGIEGLKKINAIMDYFRAYSPKSILGKPLIIKEDYLTLKATKNTETYTLNTPKDNVIKFIFKDFWFVLRPSGTEPKLKIYISVKKESLNEAKELLDSLRTELLKMTDNILESER